MHMNIHMHDSQQLYTAGFLSEPLDDTKIWHQNMDHQMLQKKKKVEKQARSLRNH